MSGGKIFKRLKGPSTTERLLRLTARKYVLTWLRGSAVAKPCVVAGWAFDFYDFSPEVGEQHGAVGAGKNPRKSATTRPDSGPSSKLSVTTLLIARYRC